MATTKINYDKTIISSIQELKNEINAGIAADKIYNLDDKINDILNKRLQKKKKHRKLIIKVQI